MKDKDENFNITILDERIFVCSIYFICLGNVIGK